MSQSKPPKSFVTFVGTPLFWLNCALFFVAATPFEYSASGLSYLIRFSCVLLLLAQQIALGRFDATKTHSIVYLVLAAFIAANIASPSDRFLQAIALIVATTLLAQIRSTAWVEQLKNILTVYLTINVVGLVSQVAWLIASGSVLELHGLIFPVDSRSESYGLFGRMSSFHNEPGTYAQWMTMMLFLRSLITGKLLNVFSLIVLASITATLSLWGVLATFAYISAICVEAILKSSKISNLAKSFGSGIILVFAVLIASSIIPESNTLHILEFFQLKAEGDSANDKSYALSVLLDKLNSVILIGQPIAPGLCPECIAPNDVGLGPNVVYYWGLIVTVMLSVVLAWRIVTRWGFAFLPPLLLFWTWKAWFYDPAVWMLIGFILSHQIQQIAPAPRRDGMLGGTRMRFSARRL